jgi:hypothetical protein
MKRHTDFSPQIAVEAVDLQRQTGCAVGKQFSVDPALMPDYRFRIILNIGFRTSGMLLRSAFSSVTAEEKPHEGKA